MRHRVQGTRQSSQERWASQPSTTKENNQHPAATSIIVHRLWSSLFSSPWLPRLHRLPQDIKKSSFHIEGIRPPQADFVVESRIITLIPSCLVFVVCVSCIVVVQDPGWGKSQWKTELVSRRKFFKIALSKELFSTISSNWLTSKKVYGGWWFEWPWFLI